MWGSLKEYATDFVAPQYEETNEDASGGYDSNDTSSAKVGRHGTTTGGSHSRPSMPPRTASETSSTGGGGLLLKAPSFESFGFGGGSSAGHEGGGVGRSSSPAAGSVGVAAPVGAEAPSYLGPSMMGGGRRSPVVAPPMPPALPPSPAIKPLTSATATTAGSSNMPTTAQQHSSASRSSSAGSASGIAPPQPTATTAAGMMLHSPSSATTSDEPLRRQMKEHQDHVARLQRDNDAVRAEERRQAALVMKLQSDLQRERAEHDAVVRGKKDDLSKLELQLAEVKRSRDVDSHQSRDQNELLTKNSQLEASLKQTEKRLRTTEAAVAALEKQVADGQRNNQQLRMALEKKEAAAREVEQQNAKLKAAVAEAEEKLLTAPTPPQRSSSPPPLPQLRMSSAASATTGTGQGLHGGLVALQMAEAEQRLRLMSILSADRERELGALARGTLMLAAPRGRRASSNSEQGRQAAAGAEEAALLKQELARMAENFAQSEGRCNELVRRDEQWQETYEAARKAHERMAADLRDSATRCDQLAAESKMKDVMISRAEEGKKAALGQAQRLQNDLRQMNEAAQRDNQDSEAQRSRAVEEAVAVLREELAAKEDEVAVLRESTTNLETVLSFYQQEKQAELERQAVEYEGEYAAMRQEVVDAKTALKKATEAHEAKLQQLNKEMVRRGASVSNLQAKVNELHDALRRTIQQLSDGQLIDKRIISGLVSNYVAAVKEGRGDQEDIVEVMAALLEWDETMKKTVQVQKRQGWGGAVGSWFRRGKKPAEGADGAESGAATTPWRTPGRRAGSEASTAGGTVDAGGKTPGSLAEMWVDFLVHEAEDNAAAAVASAEEASAMPPRPASASLGSVDRSASRDSMGGN